MPFKWVFRWVIQAIGSGEPSLTPPRHLRFTLGAEAAGSYPVTVEWNPPSSWGGDEDGAGTRSYTAAYRQILNADGSAHTGSNAAWRPTAALAADDLDHVQPDAPEDTVWEFRIRSENKLGEMSNYAILVYHARVRQSSRRFGHRFQQRFA